MCLVLGLAQGWWNVARSAFQLVGFVVLIFLTLNDVQWRLSQEVIGGNPFQFEPAKMPDIEERKKEWQSRLNVLYAVFYGPIFRNIRVGAALVMIGLSLQMVGSWPLRCVL